MTQDNKNETGLDPTLTSHSSAAMLRAGETLADRYRIEETIGVGGMGVLYRAFDKRLSVEVALKVLHAAIASDAEGLRRFESELRLARQVTHPNVVRIHDIGEHGSLCFLTMDLIKGQSLADLIATEGTLEPSRVAAIGSDIARGLAEAHANGVVHRDLKPANILIDENHAYITDFGVARSIASARLTRTGFFVGTPDYLAPEQARGDDVDGRADIYALGLMLYEMLAGKPPFSAGSLDELIVQRTLGRVPNLTRTGLAAPDDMRRIIRRCLEKRPEDRYSDAMTVARELDDGRSPRRLPAWFGRAVAGIVVVVVAIVGGRWYMDQRPAEDSARSAAPTNIVQETVTFAILPFIDVPPDPALAWISTSIVESMTAELTASANLDVVEKLRVRSTLEDLKIASGVLQPAVARQLADLFGAKWLVSGTVSSDAEQVRLDAQIISADSLLDPHQFPTLSTNLADVADLGPQIVASIRDFLSLPAPKRMPLRLSSDLDALRAYAIGVDLLVLGDSLGALEPLQEAVAADAEFAAAWLKLAETYAALGRDTEATDAVEHAVSTSASRNSRVAEMARVRQAEMVGDYTTAIERLEVVLAQEPGDRGARFMLAEMVGDEGRFSEAIGMLETLVADDPNHPRAWFLLGKFAIQNGDSQRALSEYLVNGLAIQEKLNNRQGQADVLNAMGVAEHRIGQLERAQERYGSAAQIREQIGDLRGMAASLANLARINLQLGQFEESALALDRAIEVRTQLGDQSGLAALYNIYGVLDEEKGDYRAALQRFRQALKIREETGKRRDLGNSYNNVAFAYFVLGEYDNAGVYWQLALDESITTDNPDAQMLARQSLGQLRLAQGKWAEATPLFLSSLKASRDSGYPDAEAVALGNLGRIAQQQGRYEAALSSYADALKVLSTIDDTRGKAEFTLWRASTWLELRDLQAASEDLSEAGRLLGRASNGEQKAMFDALSGSLALREDRPEEAKQLFSTALEAARGSGSDIPVLRTLIIKAEATDDGEIEDFDTLIGTVRAIGNADLLLRALYIGARMSLQQDNLIATDQYLAELTRLLDSHRPYAHTWMAHRLAAQLATRRGNAVLTAQHAATQRIELGRIASSMPATARDVFLAFVAAQPSSAK